jgi:hypothetical protein
MKNILLALLIVSVVIGCKEDKPNDPLGLRNSNVHQLDRRGGGPKGAVTADRLGPEENEKNEYGFNTKPLTEKEPDPFSENKRIYNCLWCSNSIDASASSKIVFNPLDSKAFPGTVPNSEFTNAHFCGFKCFNEFKSAYLNSSKIEIKFNDSSSTYKVLLSTK